MLTVDWEQKRPTAGEARRIWDRPVFAPAGPEKPAPTELLSALRAAFVNGGAEFARFTVAPDAHLDWFVSRNRLDEIGFLERFVRSPALRDTLPALVVGAKSKLLAAAWTSPYTLDGELAHALKTGGAYRAFPGSGSGAKALGARACDCLFGDRYEEVLVYHGRTAWSAWYHDIAWDYTWIGVDKGAREVWLLCATDTD